MALTTYSELKTAIENYLDSDSLSAQIDDIIDIAEARHKREIRIRDMLEREEINVYDRYVELPDGFLEALSFRLLTEPCITTLIELNPHEMNRHRLEYERRPKYFTVRNEIELDVIPDDSYVGEILFYKALTPLSDTNTSNALLVEAPDLYLFSSLAEAAPYLGSDERVQMWETKYVNAREALLEQNRKSRRVGPMISRVSGPTP